MNSFVGIDEEKWKPNIERGITAHEALKVAIFQAVGSASMCWVDIEKAGVFKTEDAIRVGDGLLEWIDSYIADRIEEAMQRLDEA